jgi:hypothetical protein
MAKNEYKYDRFHIRMTPETIAVMEKERGMIPMATYISEVLNRYAQEKNREQ